MYRSSQTDKTSFSAMLTMVDLKKKKKCTNKKLRLPPTVSQPLAAALIPIADLWVPPSLGSSAGDNVQK